MYNVEQVKASANGRWFEILSAAGIDVNQNKKHCPCPYCGGKDRFRCDDKNGDGTWICSQCGSGDGLELVKICMGTFKDAIDFVAGYLGVDEEKDIDWDKIARQKAEAHERNKKRMTTEAELKLQANQSAAEGAAMIMQNSEFIDSHQYLLNKQISGDTLRYMPHDFYIPAKNNKRLNIKGALIVPVINENRELINCQVIKADGFKLFLMGGRIIGGFHLIGDPDGLMLIGEGYATMATLNAATGLACVVAFNAGNLQVVAQIMDHLYPDIDKLICADNDHHLNGTKKGNVGLVKAADAADAIGCDFISPPAQKGVTDFNDFDVINGRADTIKLLRGKKYLRNYL